MSPEETMLFFKESAKTEADRFRAALSSGDKREILGAFATFASIAGSAKLFIAANSMSEKTTSYDAGINYMINELVK